MASATKATQHRFLSRHVRRYGRICEDPKGRNKIIFANEVNPRLACARWLSTSATQSSVSEGDNVIASGEMNNDNNNDVDETGQEPKPDPPPRRRISKVTKYCVFCFA